MTVGEKMPSLFNNETLLEGFLARQSRGNQPKLEPDVFAEVMLSV